MCGENAKGELEPDKAGKNLGIMVKSNRQTKCEVKRKWKEVGSG